MIVLGMRIEFVLRKRSSQLADTGYSGAKIVFSERQRSSIHIVMVALTSSSFDAVLDDGNLATCGFIKIMGLGHGYHVQ